MASLPSLPTTLRTLTTHYVARSFSTTTRNGASIFYALSALSNSRETQHFAKLTKLPRMEHSPPLKLIKTSEVDAYPCPTLKRPTPVQRPLVRNVGGSRSALRVWDERALQVGRVFLANQARQTHRLQKSLLRAKRRNAKQDTLLKSDRAAWQKERLRMRNEMRSAGMWILLSIGTATALATWRFWPEREMRRDNGELGRKIAARAAAAIPLPAAGTLGRRDGDAQSPIAGQDAVAKESPAVSFEPTMSAPIAVPVQSSPKAVETPMTVVEPIDQRKTSWWKGLFWKQQ